MPYPPPPGNHPYHQPHPHHHNNNNNNNNNNFHHNHNHNHNSNQNNPHHHHHHHPHDANRGGFAGNSNYHHHHDGRRHSDYGGNFAGNSNYYHHGAEPHGNGRGGGFARDSNHHHHQGSAPHGNGRGGGFARDSNHHHHHQHHPVQNQHSGPHYPNQNQSNHQYHHHQNQNQSQSQSQNQNQNPNQNYQQPSQQFNNHSSEHSLHSNGEINQSCGPGPAQSTHQQGRKRDHMDGGSCVKLYVANISRTTTEQELRSLFGEHGHLVEVVLLKDKGSGQQKGSCFIKYATMEEAEKAIKALNNQHTFPGEFHTLKIRYADGQMERLGPLEFKLYVGGINRQASRKDIEEIFCAYGQIEDVFVPRDELYPNRGFGFVKYSQREMAVAAINALNGNYFMRGCDQPLLVRFADPKKPRTAESRHNENLSGPSDRFSGPTNFYPQQSTGSQAEAVPERPNLLPAAPCFTQQPLQSMQNRRLEQPEMPLQQSQVHQETSQSSQDAHTVQNTIQNQVQQSAENLVQQQDLKVDVHQVEDKSEALRSSSNPSVLVGPSTMCAAPAARLDLPDCDWSEHICPDGGRYYYNSLTCESTWKKPAEFILFEQQLQKQQHIHKPSCEVLTSLSELQINSSQQDSHTEVQLHPELAMKSGLQQRSCLASEFVREHATAMSDIDPTCV